MEDMRYNNYKIDAIGTECGFGSKQSFYTPFEQVTGLKPGYYRNQLLSLQEAG
ncbi:MAG: AraC family transcriptional regulator [Bacteroidales bacterium]